MTDPMLPSRQDHHVIAIIDDTSVLTRTDPDIEPGHQYLLISNTPLGRALATILTSAIRPEPAADGYLNIAHDYQVDENLMLLVNLAAHIRMTAPDMIQLTLSLE